jgi:hypothetical protein
MVQKAHPEWSPDQVRELKVLGCLQHIHYFIVNLTGTKYISWPLLLDLSDHNRYRNKPRTSSRALAWLATGPRSPNLIFGCR